MSDRRRRVLIVDDLYDWRATLSGLLTDEGYEVRSASNITEALQIVDAERLDVAVLDIRLDETDEDNMDGLMLRHEIRKKDPRIAIIMLTGYATVNMVREAIQTSRDHFMEKTETDMLTEYIVRALER